MKKTTLAATCVLAFVFADSVRSDIVYSTFGQNDSYDAAGAVLAVGTPGNIEQAPEFFVSGSDYRLESVEIAISFVQNLGGANEITLSVFDSVNGLPGNVLDSSTVQGLPPIANSSITSFQFSGNAVLSENEVYFLAAQGSNSVFGWHYNDIGLVGDRARRQGGGAWTFNNNVNQNAFRVNGSAIPEPNSLLVFAFAAIGVGLNRRRLRPG